jgi:methylmalonyl-CoA mutase N-terminal domain/subunit
VTGDAAPSGAPSTALADAVAAWTAAHAERLAPIENDAATLSGLPVAPLYTPLGGSAAETTYLSTVGLPGEAPFTRGIEPGMYREHLWVMGQYSGVATPHETNLRIKSLLAQGQRGFSVALDLPTQNGLDSDHRLARGEVGRVGVPIDSLQDMEDLLDGIPLNEVAQIRTTANAIGPIAVALFVAAAENKGYAPTDFRVMFQNDILKEYVARGTYIFPPRAAMQFSVDVIEYCAEHMPHWEPIEFCGYHIRDSGSSAVQELGIAFANGIEYMNAAVARGLDVSTFASSLFVFLSAHLDLFEEVSKFRAARRMWSRLLEERYGVQDPALRRMKLFVYTLGSPQTAQEPLNNIVRVAYQALAAVLGGVQTLATSSFDEALGLPSDDAVRVSLRTQQILAYETGVIRTADPLGGSYFVEALTDEVETAVWRYLEQVERQGGALAALESGWLHREIEDEAYRYHRSVQDGTRTVVGVNRFVDANAPAFDAPRTRSDDATERDQLARLAAVKARRDPAAVASGLEAVRAAATAGTNTIPALVQAVRAYATVGEICDVLTAIWGRHDDQHFHTR